MDIIYREAHIYAKHEAKEGQNPNQNETDQEEIQDEGNMLTETDNPKVKEDTKAVSMKDENMTKDEHKCGTILAQNIKLRWHERDPDDEDDGS